MLDQWALFLEENASVITEKYLDVFLPKLFGVILYHFHHSDSYQESFQLSRDEAIKSDSVKSISTCYHHEQRTYFYIKQQPTLDTPLSAWLAFYQFDIRHELRDWSLPVTWRDVVEGWIFGQRDFLALHAILEPMVTQPIQSFLNRRCREFSDEECSSVWQKLCASECDNGSFNDLLHRIESDVVSAISHVSFRYLKDTYSWFYLSYKTSVEKNRLACELERAKLKAKQDDARQQGLRLLPEFYRRLSSYHGLIVPKLRFAKDVDIWPLLKSTLETFSIRERAAIILVSECSSSIRTHYLYDNELT